MRDHVDSELIVNLDISIPRVNIILSISFISLGHEALCIMGKMEFLLRETYTNFDFGMSELKNSNELLQKILETGRTQSLYKLCSDCRLIMM